VQGFQRNRKYAFKLGIACRAPPKRVLSKRHWDGMYPRAYRGVSIQDLVASQIDLSFDTLVSLPLVRAGSIKAYAVTSDTRLALAPDIPTFAEMGLPARSYSNWAGLFAPKGTPRDIIGTLNVAAVEALADPALRSRFVELGLEVFPRIQQTPEALGALVKADAACGRTPAS
jgi:tripartite-type tricarboxylate transporter receptor subunit TctC